MTSKCVLLEEGIRYCRTVTSFREVYFAVCWVHYLDLDPRELYFSYGIHGKPALSGQSDACLSFNISHSENVAVFGFAESQQIGVDIERINPLNDLDAMANLTLSPFEKLHLNANSGMDKLKYFYMLWTCKEALLKMSGNGLTQP